MYLGIKVCVLYQSINIHSHPMVFNSDEVLHLHVESKDIPVYDLPGWRHELFDYSRSPEQPTCMGGYIGNLSYHNYNGWTLLPTIYVRSISNMLNSRKTKPS